MPAFGRVLLRSAAGLLSLGALSGYFVSRVLPLPGMVIIRGTGSTSTAYSRVWPRSASLLWPPTRCGISPSGGTELSVAFLASAGFLSWVWRSLAVQVGSAAGLPVPAERWRTQ